MSFPKDTFAKPKARSLDGARKLYSPDKIKLLVKSKVQEYVQSFFDKTGANFELLQAVSPRFINYNIDRSFDPATDPTQRRLQIARYFNELRGILPCILVVDSGIDPDPQTIGLISEAKIINGEWNGAFPVTKWLPLTVLAGARDVEEVDDISSVLSLMFNELRNVGGGNYIHGRQESGETWEVVLPNEGVAVTSPIEIAIADDPIDKIWYVQLTMKIYFETVVRIKSPIPSFQGLSPVINLGLDIPQGISPTPVPSQLYSTYINNRQQLVYDIYRPVIIAPDTLSVNSQTTLLLQNFQDHYRIFLSDPQIATLSPSLVLTPRRPGTVAIRVYDPTRASQPDVKNIIAEKIIKIV